jgi:hypothetical protein
MSTDVLARIRFPEERARLAHLVPPQAGESDQDWLNRLVTAKTAVLLTNADARDPSVYRVRVREAAQRYLVIVSGNDVAPPEPTALDRERYLSERRAGKSPDEAARVATEKRSGT